MMELQGKASGNGIAHDATLKLQDVSGFTTQAL